MENLYPEWKADGEIFHFGSQKLKANIKYVCIHSSCTYNSVFMHMYIYIQPIYRHIYKWEFWKKYTKMITVSNSYYYWEGEWYREKRKGYFCLACTVWSLHKNGSCVISKVKKIMRLLDNIILKVSESSWLNTPLTDVYLHVIFNHVWTLKILNIRLDIRTAVIEKEQYFHSRE